MTGINRGINNITILTTFRRAGEGRTWYFDKILVKIIIIWENYAMLVFLRGVGG